MTRYRRGDVVRIITSYPIGFPEITREGYVVGYHRGRIIVASDLYEDWKDKPNEEVSGYLYFDTEIELVYRRSEIKKEE